MPLPLRGDFDASQLRRFARRTKDGPQARRLVGSGSDLRRGDPDRGSQDRRRDAADRAGLGGEVQRPWPRRPHRQEGARPSLAAERHASGGARQGRSTKDPSRRSMVWCAGGSSISANGSSRSSASRSPCRRSAASCARSAIAGSPLVRVIMPRPTGRSRILKKLPRAPGRDRAREGRRAGAYRSLVRRRGTHRPEEQDHAALGKARHAAFGARRISAPPRPISSAPSARRTARAQALVLPSCNTEAMNLHLAEIATQVAPGAHAVLLLDQAGWHLSGRLVVPANITHRAAAAEMPGAQSGRERLAVHARQLALEPHLQILRGHPRPLLLRLEQAHRSTLEDHVHRHTRMGLRSINENWY